MWENPGEIPVNGIDDDANGVVDDVHGYNVLDHTGDPMDDHGHGTHCAGVIGAESQNFHGGRGRYAERYHHWLQFPSAGGGGTTEGAIACLNYPRDLKTRSTNPVDVFCN